ncbi:hypothetical protein [Endozoicomonas numazuensis]|nr:hypothetical protein [Endozoicomonas numazuensis]
MADADTSSACQDIYGKAGQSSFITGKNLSSGETFTGHLTAGVYQDSFLSITSGQLNIFNPSTHARYDLTLSNLTSLCRDNGHDYSDSLELKWSQDHPIIPDLYGFNVRLLGDQCYAGVTRSFSGQSSFEMITFCVNQQQTQSLESMLKIPLLKQKVCTETRLLDKTHLTQSQCRKLFNSQRTMIRPPASVL